jgi:hypothetical protein
MALQMMETGISNPSTRQRQVLDSFEATQTPQSFISNVSSAEIQRDLPAGVQRPEFLGSDG